jgi:hypothetical protein
MRARSLVVLASLFLSNFHPTKGSPCLPDGIAFCSKNSTEYFECRDHKWISQPCRGHKGCAVNSGKTTCDQSIAFAGDDCVSGFACAENKKQTLHCEKGRYVASHKCLGPDHCAVGDNKVLCDDSIAKAGDSCISDGEFACSTDAKTRLQCRKSVFEVDSDCPTSKGCVVQDKKAYCFGAPTEIGDACDTEDGYGCTHDSRSRLKCVGGTMILDQPCEGKKGCYVVDDKAYCDIAPSRAGDECASEGEGHYFCGADSSILLCKKGHYVKQYDCLGPSGCTLERDVTLCDDTIGKVGSGCLSEGQPACSQDGKSQLKCSHGVFAWIRACRQGCRVGDDGKSACQ